VDAPRSSPSSRWRTTAVVIAVVVLVVSPAMRNRDSFPLSTYPIYAHSRSRLVTFDTVEGVVAGGDIERLSLEAIAQTDDPLIAASVVSNAIRNDDADALCATVAARVVAPVQRVEVVSEQHDTIEWLRGDDSVRGRIVHAVCAVDGG